jgi:putative peptidoglycan lipid II flippase
MPVVVLPYALGIVIFPFFSELAISGEKEKLMQLLMRALRVITFLFIPVAVLFIVLREPIVTLLFQRGAFDSHSTMLTATAMLYYSVGLCSFAVEAVLVQFYFAMSDTKTPIAVGIFCVLLNILITYYLITPLAHGGIALALTISKSVKIAVLCGLLKRRFADIQAAKFLTFLVKAGGAAVTMWLTISLVSGILTNIDVSGPFGQLLYLAALAASGSLVYVAVTVVLSLDEPRFCWSCIKSVPTHIGRRRIGNAQRDRGNANEEAKEE